MSKYEACDRWREYLGDLIADDRIRVVGVGSVGLEVW